MPVWNFVGDQQGAVFCGTAAAAPGRNSSVGMLTPLPWIGSTMKAATWRDDSACSNAARSLKGIEVHPGSSKRSKPPRKLGSSVSDKRAIDRPWKAWAHNKHDAGPAGGAAGRI